MRAIGYNIAAVLNPHEYGGLTTILSYIFYKIYNMIYLV